MQTSVGKKEVNMLSGSIMKGVLTVSIPIMVMNIAMSLFNIVDMTILRMFDADGFAVGAVGNCGSLISLITGLLIGCSAGASVVIAKFIGMGAKIKVERAVGVSILFSLVGGAVFSVIGIIFAKTFLGWMSCPAEIIEDAALYFRLYFAGLPILMLYNFSAAILRASGDSKRPMYFIIIGGVVKLAFNLFFVAVLKMSVRGVAFATIISWVVMAALIVRTLIKNKGTVSLDVRRLRLYKSELKDILIVGIPAGIQQAFYSIANVTIISTVNSFGPEASTGISIANNFDVLLYHISTAPSLAVMSYVGQNVGAGNMKRVKNSILDGIFITTALGAGFGALSAIFSGQLSSLMSDNPTVIAYSMQKMVIISSTYFICGINSTLCESLRGMGKPNIPTIATLIFMCLFRVLWVYTVFPFAPTFSVLYLVWPVSWALSIITLLPFTLKAYKQLLQKNKPKTS